MIFITITQHACSYPIILIVRNINDCMFTIMWNRIINNDNHRNYNHNMCDRNRNIIY